MDESFYDRASLSCYVAPVQPFILAVEFGLTRAAEAAGVRYFG